MAGIAELEIEYRRLVAERESLASSGNISGAASLTPVIAGLVRQIEQLQGTSSAGQVLSSEQKALAQGSNSVVPQEGFNVLSNGRIQPSTEVAASNATKFIPNLDFGTDGATRPYSQTQGIPVGSGQISAGPVREDAFISGGGIGGGGANPRLTPGGFPGVGASSDDVGPTPGTGNNKVVSELNSIDYGNKIVAQPNVLDQYASYTYQASLYLVNEQEYKTMINTKRKNISGAQLLVQSGGASAGVGRNQFFSLDYYIDNIELRSTIVGKGSGLAHNVSDVKFTIVEPNGITFIKNLDTAVQQFVGGSAQKKRNFTSQLYLLVIRFYGYDDQGNLVRGGVSKPDVTSDPNAFVEKWYPLALSNIKFKIQSKVVEYQIDATAVPYQIGASYGRGTIPYNIELSGQTLKDLLAGPTTYAAGQSAVTAGSNSNPAGTPTTLPFANTAGGAAVGARLNLGRRSTNQTPVATQASVRAVDNAIDAANTPTPPPTADSANTNKKTIRTGLMEALNNYQKDLVNQKIVEVADNYEVEFILDSMASAKVTNVGLNLSATSMTNPSTAADQKLGSKQSMDPNSRVQGATAGMQIVQFLDNLVRTSSYIKSQQIITIKESSGEQTATGINIQNTSWYKISFEVTPIKWDNKRNDYAYNIKYIISPYKISQLNSPYFKPPVYNGSHKQYSYWFTGQNDSVLSYEESLNALYYQVLSGAKVDVTSNALELLKFQHQTRSGQTDQGAEGKVNEPSANAADQLYSPTDLGECNMTIVGDPAWLQQGEAWAGIKKGDAFYFKPFLADGTINFDSQQVLFEIGYNKPADYNLQTGLIETAYGQLNSVTQQDQQIRRQGPTQINRVYIATEVRSHFSKGKFTQDLKGSLLVYNPDSNTAQQNQRVEQNNTAALNASILNTTAPKPELPRSTVTDPTPSSALAKGTEALLRPTTNGNLTDNQLLSTPAYINARRAGKSGTEALAIARAASQGGTNDYRGSILPGFRDTTNTQIIVKDQ